MEYVPCIGNSSYSFWRILLKLYRCFKDGLKICILFFQNPEIIFYHFLRIFNLDIFRALILQICIWSMYLVSATSPTVFGESFWNFTDVLRMVWRYAYCFFQNPEIIFYHFFRIFNLDIFRALILQICIWSIYLVSATPPTVFGESFWNFTVVFRMVWRYAYCFLRILKLFFLHFNLDIFSSLYATDMYREYMPCIGNPAYSFRPILLKLYRYFAAFLWFHMRNLSLAGYNCSGGASCMACSFINLDIFRALILQICIWSMYLVSATPPTVFGESFWNFTGVLRMVWRYAYCFFQNPEIIFYHFFRIFNLYIFRALILQICIWSMYLVSATPPTVCGESFWNFTGVLRMVWRYAYCFFQNPEIIFYHFLRIFNLDIFRALILQICIWSMYVVWATPPTVFGESFWNFTDVLRMVWRYAYCFFRILKLFFITFFAFLT